MKAVEDGDPDDAEVEPRGVQRSAMPERLGWGDGEGISEGSKRKWRRKSVEMCGAAMCAFRRKGRVGGIEGGGAKRRLKRKTWIRGSQEEASRNVFYSAATSLIRVCRYRVVAAENQSAAGCAWVVLCVENYLGRGCECRQCRRCLVCLCHGAKTGGKGTAEPSSQITRRTRVLAAALRFLAL